MALKLRIQLSHLNAKEFLPPDGLARGVQIDINLLMLSLQGH